MEHNKAYMSDWEGKLAVMSKKAHTRPVFVLFTGPLNSQTPKADTTSQTLHNT
jgi:hypothetical protein